MKTLKMRREQKCKQKKQKRMWPQHNMKQQRKESGWSKTKWNMNEKTDKMK